MKEQCGHPRAKCFENRKQLVQRLCSRNVLGACKKQQVGQCGWRKMSEGKNGDVVREDNKDVITVG